MKNLVVCRLSSCGGVAQKKYLDKMWTFKEYMNNTKALTPRIYAKPVLENSFHSILF